MFSVDNCLYIFYSSLAQLSAASLYKKSFRKLSLSRDQIKIPSSIAILAILGPVGMVNLFMITAIGESRPPLLESFFH